MPDGSAEVSTKTATKKKRKSKKKGSDKKTGSTEDPGQAANLPEQNDNEDDDDDVEETTAEPSRNPSVVELPVEAIANATSHEVNIPQDDTNNNDIRPLPPQNGTSDHLSQEPLTTEHISPAIVNGEQTVSVSQINELKEQIETLKANHESERSTLKKERDEALAAKERSDAQYQTLLGRVNTIKSQLGERLKADAEELSQSRLQIEQLESKNEELRKTNVEKEESISRLQEDLNTNRGEVDDLRDRTNLTNSNWVKERDDLISQLAYVKEEYENAKQAMQDWEVLAMEERSMRESLAERVGEAEDLVGSQKDEYERIMNEREVLNTTVEGLQKALQEIQEARRRELRETVEQSQINLDLLRAQTDEATRHASEAESDLNAARAELERALPFEKEVKEKNLLIGKLRHEAVILNDHLTKALRFLKRGKVEDNVDRQVVTNHLLHFVALDRSDPKKFQVLQLIAALLGWTDDQRQQAGLSRPGAATATNPNLRMTLSPFRRTSSISSNMDGSLSPTHASKESLAELWSEFLEREAETGSSVNVAGSKAASRRGSTSGSHRSTPRFEGGPSYFRSSPQPEQPTLANNETTPVVNG